MKDIKELLEGYGFSIDFEDKAQNKIRFQNEDTFIDIWEGKKGITAGIYNPKTKSIKYERRINCFFLEKLINKNNG